MQLKIPALYFSYQKLQGMIDMNFSRKKAAHAVLAWTLSLALAAPAASMTALAATDNTTQTQQTTDTQNQQPPQPPQGAPGQQQGKSASELTAAKVVDGTQATLSGETYNATETDANAVLVRNSGELSLSKATLSKTGDSSSADASNFTGQNAIFLAADSTATLSDLTLTSDADGANAVFATGSKSKVTAKNLRIHTKNNSSRGLDATYGGTIEAQDVDCRGRPLGNDGRQRRRLHAERAEAGAHGRCEGGQPFEHDAAARRSG